MEIIPEPPIIPDFLKGLSKIARLSSVEAYITRPVQSISLETYTLLQKNPYPLIAISSGGEAAALKYLFPDSYTRFSIACFGPFTRKTAKKEGFNILFTGKKFASFSDFALEISQFLK